MLALHELISFLTGLRYKGMEGEGRAGRRGGRRGGRWAQGGLRYARTLFKPVPRHVLREGAGWGAGGPGRPDLRRLADGMFRMDTCSRARKGKDAR